MGDYKEQQEMEIEALESILMDDLQVLAEVVFSHTETYPDEPPLLRARSVRGLADSDIAALQSILDSQIEENMGMPMVFQLITAAQEWITDKGTAMATPSADPEAEERKRREAEEERIAELRRHGTPCTPETFLAWKARFDAEMALKKAEIQDPAVVAAKGKISGKAWFMQHEHEKIEEPELSSDEEDGEGSRSTWSGEDREDYFGKELLDENVFATDSDDDEVLDEILAAGEEN